MRIQEEHITQVVKLILRNAIIISSLCDYSDARILFKGIITIAGARYDAAARQDDEKNRKVLFKNCVSFTDYISESNNTQIDNATDLDVIISMHNLIDNLIDVIIIQEYLRVCGIITEISQMII